MLPVIIRAGETAIRGVPAPPRTRPPSPSGPGSATIARRVVVPTAMPGVITGVLLAVARGLGETAPLLFTIFGNQYLQWNPTKPMDALPIVIYNEQQPALSRSRPDRLGGRALLLMVVLLLSIGSRFAAAFLRRERTMIDPTTCPRPCE